MNLKSIGMNSNIVDNGTTSNICERDKVSTLGCERVALKKISPRYKEKVAICMVLNEPFAIFASVTLQSIIEFSSVDNNYDIFICMDVEFTSTTKIMLENQVASKKNISLRFIDLSGFVDFQNTNNQNATYPSIVYGRLFLPYILDRFKKVIYVDSDIVLNSDISSFYYLDLKDKCLAGVNDLVMLAWLRDKEHWAYHEIIDKVKVPDTKKYINSGFLIFDVKNYNDYVSPTDILEFEKKHYLKWPDQDLINIMFWQKILYLEQNCNVLISLREDKKTIDNTKDKELIESYYNSFKMPKVIHFLGCSFLSVNYPVLFYDLYWSMARKTPYYETLMCKAISASNELNIYTLLEKSSIKSMMKIIIKKTFRLR